MALADIAALLQTAFGQSPSTKTTTSDTSGLKRMSSQATSNSDNALQNLLPILQEAARQASIAYAPTLVGQNKAGVYNSSTNRLLSQQAARSTAAQQAATVTQYQTDQQKIALQAEMAAAQGNQTTTAESTGLLSSIQPYILPAVAGYTALKNAPDIIDAVKDPGKALAESDIGKAYTRITAGPDSIDKIMGSAAKDNPAVFGGASADAGSNFSSGAEITAGNGVAGSELYGPFNTPADIAYDQGATVENLSLQYPSDIWANAGDLWSPSITTDVTGDVGSIAADAGLSGAAEVGPDLAADTAVSFTTDAGTAAAADGMTEMGAESVGEYLPYVGSAFNLAQAGQNFADGDIRNGITNTAAGVVGAIIPYGGLMVKGGQMLTDTMQGFADGIIGDDASAILFDPIDSALGAVGSIVCTLLEEQGRLNKDDLRQSGIKFNKRYSRLAKEAYYLWSRPAVKYMKASPKTWLAERITRIMQRRTDYVCGRGFFKEASAFWEVEIFTTVLGILALPWLLYKVYWRK